jgi:guanylate kinase
MSSKKLKHKPFLIILSSPSGAGKTTICREVVRSDRNIGFSVSATTRPKRPGEKHGQDYFFYRPKDFAAKKAQGKFIETAKVYEHFYGTLKSEVKKIFNQGKDVILDVDVQGMKSIKRNYPNSVAIFITPSNLTELQKRLFKRNEPKAEIKKRANYLRAELSAMPKFNYLVYNDNLKTALSDVSAIIKAERLKTKRINKNNYQPRRN